MRKKILYVGMLLLVLLFVLTSCGHKHEWSDWKIVTMSTCTEKGVEERTCSCGESEKRDVGATGHEFGDWSVKTSATCVTEGKKEKICSVCNHIQIENIPATGHNEAEKIVKAVTCGTNGEVQKYCTTCSLVLKTETIYATNNHSYNSGVVTLEPTCTEAGKKTVTCTTCQATTSMDIAKLGHSLDSKHTCTRCGLLCINMTQTEINNSKKVESMSYSFVESSTGIQINITLKDENGYSLQIPVYVYVKIVDEKNEILYEGTLIKSASQSKITIPNDDIKAGYSNIGTLNYKVYNDYVTFNTISGELDDLDWTVDVELPDLPETITYSGYSNSSICKVIQITYKVSGDDITFYFEGEKIYDSNGDNYSSSCKIGWKLYDEDNYVIKDGTLYTNSLATGEKFKNESVNIYNCMEPGKSYRLVIMNVS